MNKTEVKQFLVENHKNIKIKYIRNVYGYKAGVVIKIGRGTEALIGWSTVHPSQDSTVHYRKPHQLPIYQWMERNGVSYHVILSSGFYHKLLENGCVVNIPRFDKYEGLAIAIERALNREVFVDETGDVLLPKSAPFNDYLASALRDIAE